MTEGLDDAIEHRLLRDTRSRGDPRGIAFRRGGHGDHRGSLFIFRVGGKKLPFLPSPLAEGGGGRFLIEQLTDGCSHRDPEWRALLDSQDSWDPRSREYEPGSQESVLPAMTEEVGASYEMINALIGLGELLRRSRRGGSVPEARPGFVSGELTGAEAAYVRMQRNTGLELEGSVGTLLGNTAGASSPRGWICIGIRSLSNR